MGIVVPKVRKHLCADALLRSVQDVFSHIPDHRKGDLEIPLRDALMSAFAMFSLKSPSLLAFDKERTEDDLQRVYGIGRGQCLKCGYERFYIFDLQCLMLDDQVFCS